MTSLLELKEKIKSFYARFETYIHPVVKFLVAFAVFFIINQNIGYMSKISGLPVTMLLALFSAILPVNGVIVLAGLVIILHMYALAVEVAAAAIAIFLVGYLLYFRFAPGDGMRVLLTPVCLHYKLGPVMPVSTGLLGEAYSVVSVLFGTFVYYFLSGVRENASLLGDLESDDSKTSKIKIALNQLFGNKEMYLVMVSFLLVTIIIYFIRRLSVEYSWSIAIVIGVVINFIIQFSGYLMLGISGRIQGLVISTILTLPIAFVIQFLFFHLDYSRIERVQFEDDEYYYYVKAVPKMMVAGKAKKVKKFSSKDDFDEEDTERFFEEMQAKNGY